MISNNCMYNNPHSHTLNLLVMPITGNSISVKKTIQNSTDRCLTKVELATWLCIHCTLNELYAIVSNVKALKSAQK